jgi:uncharacterized protein (DUF305 family)
MADFALEAHAETRWWFVAQQAVAPSVALAGAIGETLNWVSAVAARPCSQPPAWGWLSYSLLPVKAPTCLLISALTLTMGTGISCRAGGSPAAGAAPPILQPGAPGQSTRVVSVAQATDLSGIRYTDADVQFMQGMIGHHAQAIEMTTLLASRTESRDMKLLAQRIDVSQADEIKMMQEWLQRRGQPLPDPHAHHHGATLMPGMLTSEEMGRLEAARGPEFDRLFLEYMIKHHIGALTMVEALFATPGAGQDPEIFAFASDVDSDQRMEIDRMGAMLVVLKERH